MAACEGVTLQPPLYVSFSGTMQGHAFIFASTHLYVFTSLSMTLRRIHGALSHLCASMWVMSVMFMREAALQESGIPVVVYLPMHDALHTRHQVWTRQIHERAPK